MRARAPPSIDGSIRHVRARVADVLWGGATNALRGCKLITTCPDDRLYRSLLRLGWLAPSAF